MNEMLKTWGNVITHPKQTTFDNELCKAHATQKTAVVWLISGILLAAAVNGLSSYFYETIFHSYIGSRQVMVMLLFQQSGENSALLDFIGSPIFGGIFSFLGFLIGLPIVLFLGNLVSLWLAKALGGTRSFEKQLFAMALFAPGLLIIASIFGVIRQIGVCVASPIFWVYAIILSILAVKSIHGLSTAKSAITVIVPFVVITLVVIVISPPHL